jgi:hypothetical protein
VQDKNENFKRSYQFFEEKLKTEQSFTLKELSEYVGGGWKETTPKTYLSKKWRGLFTKSKQGYVINAENFIYDEDSYCRMMSQSRTKSEEPFKPELPDNVECLVEKAREAAVLAIDIYNRPMTVFRSQGFIVMMIIAWTSLLHAIFESEETDYNYYNKDGQPEILDGDKKTWELSTCINHCSKITEAVKKNISFFIGIRNKIEHRYAPAIDITVFGQSQALLYNFETLLTKEYGTYYSLNNTLTIPLQVIMERPSWQADSMKKYQAKHYQEIKEYIDAYHASLSEDVHASQEYSFRVYLVPKLGNHHTSSDVAVEFIKYDPENPEQFQGLEKQIVAIKGSRTVQVANQGKLKPKDVSTIITSKIEKRFRVSDHTKAWKFYKVRSIAKQAEGCNTKYCQFDEAHKDYIYTQEWVEFLIEKLSDDNEYSRVMACK